MQAADLMATKWEKQT